MVDELEGSFELVGGSELVGSELVASELVTSELEGSLELDDSLELVLSALDVGRMIMILPELEVDSALLEVGRMIICSIEEVASLEVLLDDADSLEVGFEDASLEVGFEEASLEVGFEDGVSLET